MKPEIKPEDLYPGYQLTRMQYRRVLMQIDTGTVPKQTLDAYYERIKKQKLTR